MMKEVHIRLREDQYEHVRKESEKRGISMSEYLRLLLLASSEDEEIKREAMAKLWFYGLSLNRRKKILERTIRKEKRKGPLESYVEGILRNNPNAETEYICKSIIRKFNIPIIPNMRKMIRRKKKSWNKKLERYRQKNGEKGTL